MFHKNKFNFINITLKINFECLIHSNIFFLFFFPSLETLINFFKAKMPYKVKREPSSPKNGGGDIDEGEDLVLDFVEVLV